MTTGEKLLIVPLPDDAKKKLRVIAATQGTSMRQLVKAWVDSLKVELVER